MKAWFNNLLTRFAAAAGNAELVALREELAEAKEREKHQADQILSVYKTVCKLAGALYSAAGHAALERKMELHNEWSRMAKQAEAASDALEELRPKEAERRVVHKPDEKTDPAKPHITECLRAYIGANDTMRKNRWSWMSVHPNPNTPEGKEYRRLRDAYEQAESALWMSTDIEFSDTEFREAVWNWRYWKVMARKCCWYQRFGTTNKAGWTMSKLQRAETKLVEVCGLTDIYRTNCSYIEEQFPNLKMKE